MLQTIPDLSDSNFQGAIQSVWEIAPRCVANQVPGLIPGTEHYVDEWLSHWHQNQPETHLDEVSCFLIKDATISGNGNIWLGGRLISAAQVMPDYVANILEVNSGGSAAVLRRRSETVRTVKEPCLVAIGHGTHVYGHFLIEVAFRLLVAQHARSLGLPNYKVLIARGSPPWYLYLLIQYFQVDFHDIPRSRENPEIRWVYDAEVIRNLIAPVLPVFRHVVAQEVQHGDAEILEACVAFVVGDVSVHQSP